MDYKYSKYSETKRSLRLGSNKERIRRQHVEVNRLAKEINSCRRMLPWWRLVFYRQCWKHFPYVASTVVGVCAGKYRNGMLWGGHEAHKPSNDEYRTCGFVPKLLNIFRDKITVATIIVFIMRLYHLVDVCFSLLPMLIVLHRNILAVC